MLGLVGLLGAGALAQAPVASVSGTALDAQRRPLAGATVVVSSLETGDRHSTASSEAGRFRLVGVAPGAYELSVSLAGFTSHHASLRLGIGEARDVEITMQLETVAAAVIGDRRFASPRSVQNRTWAAVSGDGGATMTTKQIEEPVCRESEGRSPR